MNGATTKQSGRWSRFPLSLLICGVTAAGCSYDYPEQPPDPPHSAAVTAGTAAPLPAGGPQEPYSAPEILAREAGNYAELYRLLRAVPGSVILFEVGPLDGPVRGFGTTTRVPATGRYTVSAACVGATGAEVSVGQDHPGAPFRPLDLVLDCTGTTSEVIDLQEGYIFAHLLLPAPGDTPWTGAVGGVKVTR